MFAINVQPFHVTITGLLVLIHCRCLQSNGPKVKAILVLVCAAQYQYQATLLVGVQCIANDINPTSLATAHTYSLAPFSLNVREKKSCIYVQKKTDFVHMWPIVCQKNWDIRQLFLECKRCNHGSQGELRPSQFYIALMFLILA